jgi:hypothetical protein
MKTLKEIIEEQKARRGPATGTTKRGAYWIVGDPIKIRSHGGDGIGQNAPDHEHWLSFRHFRAGDVRASLHKSSRHQNGSYSGGGDSYHDVSEILDCTTIEDVVVVLKSINLGQSDYQVHAYSDYYREDLAEILSHWGMPESLPAPDDAR